MLKPCKKRATGCPIAFALDTFGDRWSLLVVRDLMMRGRKTYGEFLDSGEKIATNILADRLKHLEAVGIVGKSQDPENRRRNIYSLTEKGVDLAPLILELVLWSAKYDPESTTPKDVVDRIRDDREGFVAEIRSRLI